MTTSPPDYPPATPPRRTGVVLAIAIGVVPALLFIARVSAQSALWPDFKVALILPGLAGVLVACLPPLRSALAAGLDRLDRLCPTRLTIFVFAASLGVFLFVALGQRVRLGPESHDEFSYLLGARMLASGRLWAPALPAPDSFESFHIFTTPVYASIYPPGTALLHAPGLVLGVPPWITAMLIACLAVTMTFHAVRVVAGTAAGVLAALVLLGAQQVRTFSVPVMSHTPAMLLAATLLYLAARYRSTDRPATASRLAMLIGLLGGLLILVRPQDAAWTLPATLYLVFPRLTPRNVALAAGAAGLLLWLLPVQNHALTGSFTHTGYWKYTQLMQPGTGFSADRAATAEPATLILQKRDLADTFLAEAVRLRGRGYFADLLTRRLPTLLYFLLPTGLLLTLVPVGLWSLGRNAPGRAFLVALLGYLLLYGSFTFYIANYTVPIAGCVAAVCAAGVMHLPRGARAVAAAVLLCGAVVSITQTPLEMATDDLRLVDRVAAELPEKPALLLIRYTTTPDNVFVQEPVYNLDHWRLKDNPVIRAHDLTPDLNLRLFTAFSDDPDLSNRTVYRYDRLSRTLTRLGRVTDLAHPPATRSSPP